MEFVPYAEFKNIEFIAEGGFSKIYKAIWIDGPITWEIEKRMYNRDGNKTIVLKEINNSKNISSKELNELIIYCSLRKTYTNDINRYYGITQYPVTLNYVLITDYYDLGDLTHYIKNKFFSITWIEKLARLLNIAFGLTELHNDNIIHKDFHSGNILISSNIAKSLAAISDFGLSKSSLNNDDDNEIYGIIPYVAPEVLQGQKYTKASDIYSFGMIMWELMTGRRPFWDRNHDVDLIIEICDGIRPPIVTNAPEGYIKLMKKCWHSDPNKRPSAYDIWDTFNQRYGEEKIM
ncbi:hypothetical protein RclHR1_01980019 [Rhizophagus clarus]|uniref:Protein kinase domain-containing protein n=1 Tax=Rhizophagus clarus TaxID=94130 RepID=A0A2Z6R3F5_9GLOM|nr:hypothetical protein RclHR1_01980019 [Rhizophagus clarus]